MFTDERDRWLIDKLRGQGFTSATDSQIVYDRRLFCRLLFDGESGEQANDEISQITNMGAKSTVELTTGAMMAYENCSWPTPWPQS